MRTVSSLGRVVAHGNRSVAAKITPRNQDGDSAQPDCRNALRTSRRRRRVRPADGGRPPAARRGRARWPRVSTDHPWRVQTARRSTHQPRCRRRWSSPPGDSRRPDLSPRTEAGIWCARDARARGSRLVMAARRRSGREPSSGSRPGVRETTEETRLPRKGWKRSPPARGARCAPRGSPANSRRRWHEPTRRAR